MQIRKDRRTPPPLEAQFRGYPYVSEYKYLGVYFDDCLNIEHELGKKKELEKAMQSQLQRMNYMCLDKGARYHVWQALFKSRLWYSLVLTSRISTKMKEWMKGYLYRSVIGLMRVKGKPQKDRVFQATFNQDKEQVIEAIWKQALTAKLLKTPETSRAAVAARLNLDDQIPLDQDSLREMLQEAKTTWKTAKQALTTASPGLFKWWTGARFQGHHKDSVTKCKCPEQTTVTQSHVLSCEEYRGCFEATAAQFDSTAEEVMEMVQSRDPENYSREDLATLNEIEDHLSAQMLTKINGMSRPARARQ